MTEKRSYRQYPREFKEEAVVLITDQGCSVQKAADSLGIRSNLLYRWQRQLEDQQSGKSLSEDERTELKELRKEVRELRMEKTILKKASALFAKEMKCGLVTSRTCAPMKAGCIWLLSWIYIRAALSAGLSINA